MGLGDARKGNCGKGFNELYKYHYGLVLRYFTRKPLNSCILI